AIQTALLDTQDLDELQYRFWQQLQHYPEITFIYWADEQGRFAGSIRNEDGSISVAVAEAGRYQRFQTNAQGEPTQLLYEITPYDPRDRPWYQSASQRGAASWSPIFVWSNGSTMSVDPVLPLYNPDDELQGVVGVSLGLLDASNFLEDLAIGKNGEAIIIEQSGELVATSTGELPFTIPPGGGTATRLQADEIKLPLVRAAVQHLQQEFGSFAQIQTGQQLTFDNGRQRQFVEVVPFQDDWGLDWLIVVTVPEADFMAQVYANRQQTILLCLGALGLATLMGLLTAHKILRPIAHLTQASEAAAGGSFEQSVQPTRISELNDLATAFNGMIDKQKRSFAALRQSEATNRAIVDSIPDLMIRARGDGTYLEIVGSDRLQGIHSAQFFNPGSTVLESLPPDLAELRMRHIHQALATGTLQVYEQTITVAGRPQEEEVRVLVLGENEVLIMVRDITDRKQNERLKEENLRMGTELDVARHIQQMILPRTTELASINALDIAGYMLPADEVGGDYYDVMTHEDTIQIGIGDVTGHGLESGMVMLMTQTAIRTLQIHRADDPVTVLDTLNRTIYENTQRMQSDKTLTLALLDYRDGQLRITGQHEEVIIARAAGTVERINTVDLGFPLGLVEDIRQFVHAIHIPFNVGDVALLYTDGVTEAENPARSRYGIERLCQKVQTLVPHTALEICQALTADIKAHLGSQNLLDDMTLVILKRKY
ncbi:MAG TPA: SpoIIE family protein phosphatase, partial [Candidatus Obscuribacterales bacterium]